MAEVSVSVHELKAKLSAFLGRTKYRKERIIISRRNKPIAMLVPLDDEETDTGEGLDSISAEDFVGIGEMIDRVYAGRQAEGHREVPL